MANLAYFQLLRECNQYCRFCSNPPTNKEHTLEDGKRFIDSLIAQGWHGVILTGGEPTLAEYLPELLAYCRDKTFPSRVISNGQRLAHPEYAARLKDSGLTHVHLSLHSIFPEVHDFITQTKGALRNMIRALENIGSLGGIHVNINCVINRYNADHLSLNVRWLVRRFPFIDHFVWNNLDPRVNRATKNTDTIHRLSDVQAELFRSMSFLTAAGKTFRVEKMPLCYLPGFEHLSTETRKIVKGEVRRVAFLDSRQDFFQDRWTYGKAECCKVCSLNDICAGLFEMDHYYFSDELFPVFADPQAIRSRILEEEREAGPEAPSAHA